MVKTENGIYKSTTSFMEKGSWTEMTTNSFQRNRKKNRKMNCVEFVAINMYSNYSADPDEPLNRDLWKDLDESHRNFWLGMAAIAIRAAEFHTSGSTVGWIDQEDEVGEHYGKNA